MVCKHTGELNDRIEGAGWSPGLTVHPPDEVPVRLVMEGAVQVRRLWTCGEYLSPIPLDR